VGCAEKFSFSHILLNEKHNYLHWANKKGKTHTSFNVFFGQMNYKVHMYMIVLIFLLFKSIIKYTCRNFIAYGLTNILIDVCRIWLGTKIGWLTFNIFSW
jgi:hypothetical protein